MPTHFSPPDYFLVVKGLATREYGYVGLWRYLMGGTIDFSSLTHTHIHTHMYTHIHTHTYTHTHTHTHTHTYMYTHTHTHTCTHFHGPRGKKLEKILVRVWLPHS